MTDTSGQPPNSGPPPAPGAPTQPSIPWWQYMLHGQLPPDPVSNFMVQPGGTPLEGAEKWLYRNLFGVSQVDPSTGWATGYNNPGDIVSHIAKPIWEGIKWFVSPSDSPKPAVTPTAPKPDDTDPQKPPDKGANQPVLTIPGAGAGSPPPTIPPPVGIDLTAYRKALAAAKPTAPVETQEDKLWGIMGGLAAGLQNWSPKSNAGNLLLNLGMGSLSGLAGAGANYKKAMQTYNEALNTYNEKVASGELNAAELTQKQAQLTQDTASANANNLWKWHQQQLALLQPRVLSTKGGVVTVESPQPDGSKQIHLINAGFGGAGGPQTNIPYYETPAGQMRADQPISAAYAALGAREQQGTLYGDEKPGQPQTYLLTSQMYKQLSKTAADLTNQESATRGGGALTGKDYALVYHQHLYQLVYQAIQEQMGPKGIEQLVNIGQKTGTLKSVKTAEPSIQLDTSGDAGPDASAVDTSTE